MLSLAILSNHQTAVHKAPSSNSTMGSFLTAIASALDQYRVQAAVVFEDAGLEMDADMKPETRVSIIALRRVWLEAVRRTGDDAFGLCVARHVRSTTFHALSYSLWASETLEAALIRNARYQNMISDALEITLQREGGRIRVSVVNSEPLRAWEGLDCCMAWMMAFGRELYRQDLAPLAVSMARPRPTNSNAFSKFFRSPIHYRQSANYLDFDTAVLQEPLAGKNPDLAKTGDQLVESYLARRKKSDFSGVVHGLLVSTLSSGECTQELIANSLHLTTRNLQRKLADENTSFSELLESARRELAEHYIAEPQLSLTDITFLLGFSNSNSFARAFKQWFGKSPREYRAS